MTVPNQVQHRDHKHAAGYYVNQFHSHTQGRFWLGVTFYVDEKGELHLDRTTYKFPHARYAQAVALLQQNLELELGRPIEPSLEPPPPPALLPNTPLPIAPEFMGMDPASPQADGSRLVKMTPPQLVLPAGQRTPEQEAQLQAEWEQLQQAAVQRLREAAQ